MADPRIEKQYAKLLEQRAKIAAKNAAEGRTMNMPGVPLNERDVPASTLSEVMDTLRSKGSPVTTIENTIKTTPKDTIGILPEVRNKSKFFNLDNKLGNVGEAVEDAGRAVNEDAGGLLRNAKGFSKVLPALGLGATALGALSVANKVMAGEPGQAGLEATDLATDYVPVLGQVKMAVRPTDIGDSELPEDVMKQREVFNAARRAKDGQPVNNPSQDPSILEPEDRAKYEDMKKMFSGISDRMKGK